MIIYCFRCFVEWSFLYLSGPPAIRYSHSSHTHTRNKFYFVNSFRFLLLFSLCRSSLIHFAFRVPILNIYIYKLLWEICIYWSCFSISFAICQKACNQQNTHTHTYKCRAFKTVPCKHKDSKWIRSRAK